MKKGFTLIELLVVVLIIGILAAIALPQYQKSVDKARMSEAMMVLRSIKDASDRYKLANDVQPTSFDDLDIDISLDCTADKTQCSTTNFRYAFNSGTCLTCMYAFSKNNSGFFLERNTTTNNFWCAAPITDGSKNSVCKSISGTNTPHHSGASTHYYLISGSGNNN
ncbi:Type II secretion system subunit [Elusimicrobium minutum Pei191]|uniref:Type II secretion system subunit n=1 Tax=Elusimicrobium minutum (strain Pei191) TaxID=445932 RepID=B2KC41_ELUMP|nr:type II secretion system protein [Elusimicrobium minutum]ACC98168.1 Type II secretion system subunit [Elusimicrobium minutum Pei191]